MEEREKRIRTNNLIAFGLFVVCGALGGLFIYKQWAYSNELIILSSVGITVIAAMRLINLRTNDIQLWSRLILMLFFNFMIITNNARIISARPYRKLILVAILALIAYELIFKSRNDTEKQQTGDSELLDQPHETKTSSLTASKVLYAIGAIILIVGVLFKIQHWAGASIALIAGAGTVGLSYFIGLFNK